MSRFFRLVGACALVAAAPMIMASRGEAGKVHNIYALRAGPVIFEQSGARSARPSCSTLDRWAIETSTSAGQAIIAVLLTAYSSNKNVIVQGSGDCSVWGDTETVEFIVIPD